LGKRYSPGSKTGIGPVLETHGIRQPDAQILDLYAQLESEAEGGEFKNYKSILRTVLKGIGEETGFEPTPEEMNCLVEAVPHWKPFPDTVRALKALKKRFKLAILSNIDDDLIAYSLKHLKVEFDRVITAQQIKSYKPSLNNFQEMIDKIGPRAFTTILFRRNVWGYLPSG
jgi:2-haloacid dehalogenase